MSQQTAVPQVSSEVRKVALPCEVCGGRRYDGRHVFDVRANAWECPRDTNPTPEPTPIRARLNRAREARHIEARARAKDRGVRLLVVEPGNAYSTKSQSERGVVYTVSRGREGWQCECKGFVFTGCCKHVGAVERRSEREGWSFGRIAPRPRMAA